MIDVSIVIVNYNLFEILRQCLDSIILHSSGFTYEIIIVDNDSNEGDIFEHFKDYPQVKIIRNPVNLGFAKANNIGIDSATGNYVLILNNDTIFIENTIKILLDFIKNKQEEIFIACKLLNSDHSFQVSICDFDSIINAIGEAIFLSTVFSKSKIFNRFYLNHLDINQPTEVDIVKGAFILAKREFLLKLNCFDERFYFYAEESDLCFRAKKYHGAKIIYYPGTSIIHLGGTTTDLMPWFKYKNQSIAKIKFYQKNYKASSKYFLIALHYLGIGIRIIVYLAVALFGCKMNYFTKAYYYYRMLFLYPKNEFANKISLIRTGNYGNWK